MKLNKIWLISVLSFSSPLFCGQIKSPTGSKEKKRIELFVESPSPGYCSKRLDIVEPKQISEFENFLQSSSKEDSEVMPCGYDIKVLLIKNDSDTNEVLINSECGYMKDSKGIVGNWKKYNGSLNSLIKKTREIGKPAKLCWNG